MTISTKRIATIAVAAALAAGFATSSFAASKARTGAAWDASRASPTDYPTYQPNQGGCLEDQGNGRIVPCTN
jgi:hypothetical protein